MSSPDHDARAAGRSRGTPQYRPSVDRNSPGHVTEKTIGARTPNFGVLDERVVGLSLGQKPTIAHVTSRGTSLEQNALEQGETGGKMVDVSA
jgi:hypothetical protein